MMDASTTIEVADWDKLSRRPLVSVYMLTYNHERYVAEAIESVVAQECSFSFELIIGEDCSRDLTREVVHDCQQRYPGLIRILTSNRNVGSVANSLRCRDATRGRFVAICEGDDFWTDPKKLQVQVDLLLASPKLACVGHAVDAQDARDGSRWRAREPAFSSRMLSMRELIRGGGFLIPTVSVMCRREVVTNQPDWQREAHVGDYPMMLRAKMQGEVLYLRRKMAVFRVGVAGSWTQRRGKALQSNWEHAQGMARILQGFDRDTGHQYTSDVKRAISKYYSDALVYTIGSRSVRREHYSTVSRRLRPMDRLFSWSAAAIGVRASWFKAQLRKAATLVRIIHGELAMPKLAPEARSKSGPPEAEKQP